MRDAGQAQIRRDVARLLGIPPHTIGHWLTLYEALWEHSERRDLAIGGDAEQVIPCRIDNDPLAGQG
jgi:hypothetical protein